MKRFTCLGIFIAAAAMPSAAMSQRMVTQRTLYTQIGECLVRVAPAMTRDILAMPPGSPGQSEAIRTMLTGRFACVRHSNAISFPSRLMLTVLAGAWLNRDPALLDRVAALPHGSVRRPVVGLAPEQIASEVAQCLAVARPAEAVALLRTDVGMPAERSAVLDFGQSLSDCTPTDVAYHVNIPELRGNIAYAVYRRAMVAGSQEEAA